MKFKYHILLLVAAFGIFGFSSPQKRKKVYQIQPKGMVYVPAGSFVNESNMLVNTSALWMQETEVTNEQYKEYLHHLKTNGLSDSFKKAYPDTSLINSEFWTNEYFPYFEHSVFNDYPVVGLSLVQINDYAQWLTTSLHNKNPAFEMTCRLPTHVEWQYAAAGGRSTEGYAGLSVLANSLGNTLFRFFDGNIRYMVYEGIENAPDYYDVNLSKYQFKMEKTLLMYNTKNFEKIKPKTVNHWFWMYGLPASSHSTFPNDFGLYGMAGNVAELVTSFTDTIAVGGSFKTGPAYCKIKNAKPYPFNAAKPQTDLGFRLVCEYIEPISRR